METQMRRGLQAVRPSAASIAPALGQALSPDSSTPFCNGFLRAQRAPGWSPTLVPQTGQEGVIAAIAAV
jgi:hypothetical protein